MKTSNPKICIIVLNFNGKNLLKDCLSSLIKTTYKNIEIVVVDNFSSDGSSEYVKQSFPKVHLIENKHNFGWTGGNNIGIKYALKKGAWAVLLLNNDTKIEKNTIELIVKKLISKNEIGIVGPKIYEYDSKPPIISNAGNFLDKDFRGKDLGNGKKDRGQYNKIEDTDYVAGTAMTIKTEVFNKIGYFDNKLFIYYDDLDFCLRARKAGFRCCFEQRAILYHIGSATHPVSSPFHTYYNTRNRLIILKRYASYKTILIEFFRLIKPALRFIVKRNNSDKYVLLGVRDYVLKRFGERRYW